MITTVRVRCPVCGEVERPGEKLPVLARTSMRLSALVRGLSDERLSARPLLGEWSVREIVCHLADTEVIRSYRVMKILAEDQPGIEAYDEVVWAKALALDLRDPGTLLRSFRRLREAFLDLLARAPVGAMERAGFHAEYGPITVAQLTGHTVDHDLLHLAQIKQTLAEAAR